MGWDDLIEMFNPGHKHLAEERDRKRIEAQLPGSEADDDPHAAGVDLERGIIFLPKAEEHPEDEPFPITAAAIVAATPQPAEQPVMPHPARYSEGCRSLA